MIFIQLFISFFKVGMFAFGGGMAAMPLIKAQVVELHQWLSLMEFTDLITIAEMTPGPIAINSATFVGIRVAGIPGALVATFGCFLPSCFIVGFLTFIYRKYKEVSILQGILAGLRPAIVALIASAGVSIVTLAFWNGEGTMVLSELPGSLNYIGVLIFIGGLIALKAGKMDPIKVMIGCGVLGGVLYML